MSFNSQVEISPIDKYNILYHTLFMKKALIITVLITVFYPAGMTLFAQGQDMSFYTREYNRTDSTPAERLLILESVRDAGLSGIGDFYHDALRVFLQRFSTVRFEDRHIAAASARILAQGLGAEAYNPAAPDLWRLAELYDIARDVNQGLEMQDALIALGQVNGTAFITQIVQRLDDLNTQSIADLGTRERVQRAVVGCVRALELLGNPAGFRSVFEVWLKGYENPIRDIARNALPSIAEDPVDIMISMIRSPSNDPAKKLRIWEEMQNLELLSDESLARVAAAALDIGWAYSTSSPAEQTNLRVLRTRAIDIIRILGAADNSVYANLERSYTRNLTGQFRSIEEINITLHTLAALGTEEAVQLLVNFLRVIDNNHQARTRLGGSWQDNERLIFQMLINALGASRTESVEVMLLLRHIDAGSYTNAERQWARTAMSNLGF